MFENIIASYDKLVGMKNYLLSIFILLAANVSVAGSARSFRDRIADVQKHLDQRFIYKEIDQLNAELRKRGLLSDQDYHDFHLLKELRQKSLGFAADRWKSQCDLRGKIKTCVGATRKRCQLNPNWLPTSNLDNFEVSNSRIKQGRHDNGEITVLNSLDVEELSNILGSLTSMFNGYAVQGCEERAHFSAVILDSFCVQSAKGFISGNGLSENWAFHVANVVLVETENGIEPYMIDPHTKNFGVDVGTWVQSITYSPVASGLKFRIKNKYVYTHSDIDKQFSRYQQSDKLLAWIQRARYSAAALFNKFN